MFGHRRPNKKEGGLKKKTGFWFFVKKKPPKPIAKGIFRFWGGFPASSPKRVWGKGQEKKKLVLGGRNLVGDFGRFFSFPPKHTGGNAFFFSGWPTPFSQKKKHLVFAPPGGFNPTPQKKKKPPTEIRSAKKDLSFCFRGRHQTGKKKIFFFFFFLFFFFFFFLRRTRKFSVG